MLTGIDVSQWQGPDPQMDADVIGVKASEGMGVANKDFAAQVAKARRLGKRVQLYHYSWPAQDVGAELANFSRQIGPVLLPGDVLVLDWEWYPPKNLPTNQQAATYKAAWFARARAMFPDHRLLLYTNRARWNDPAINPDKACGDGLWVAEYGVPQGKPAITDLWIGHQWQGAPLDRSVWAFEDLAAYDRWATPAPSDPVAALRQRVDELDDWADTVDTRLDELAGVDTTLTRLDETTAALIERLAARVATLEQQAKDADAAVIGLYARTGDTNARVAELERRANLPLRVVLTATQES